MYMTLTFKIISLFTYIYIYILFLLLPGDLAIAVGVDGVELGRHRW